MAPRLDDAKMAPSWLIQARAFLSNPTLFAGAGTLDRITPPPGPRPAMAPRPKDR